MKLLYSPFLLESRAFLGSSGIGDIFLFENMTKKNGKIDIIDLEL